MTTDRTIIEIPLEELYDSPFNPPDRSTLAIDEMADSIKSAGRILQALLVRPRIISGGQQGFEIVYGHRRRYGAEAAGLATAPCEARAMTDEEVRAAQAVENLQREALQAFEEAEAYASMIERDKLTAEQVAERAAKSRSHVYARLKLLHATPEIRQACFAGEIGSEAALLITRLRSSKMQIGALAYLKSHNADITDGGKKSFRQIRDLLADRYQLSLKQAIFDRDDATLLPDAGACTTCPKRSGNAPEFDDVVNFKPHSPYDPTPGGADVCTDPDCFAEKKKAHLARAAAKLEESGKSVIAGNKARAVLAADGKVKTGAAYVPVDAVKKALKAAKADVKPVVVQDQRTGKTVQVYARQDLIDAGLTGMKAPAKKPGESPSAQKAAHEAKRKAEELQLQQQNGAQLALLTRVREVAASRQRDAFELRLIAAAAIAGTEYEARGLLAKLHGMKSIEALEKKMPEMTGDELGVLLLDCALVNNVVKRWPQQPKPAALLNLAGHYGIDIKAIAAEASGAASDLRTANLLDEIERIGEAGFAADAEAEEGAEA